MGDRSRRRSRSPHEHGSSTGSSNIQQRLKQLSGAPNDTTSNTNNSSRDNHRNNSNSNNNERAERSSTQNGGSRGGGEDLKIDREKTCPLLLRVFCQIGRHHRPDEFSSAKTPANELQIYTWKDATLKELMSLVKEVNPEARHKGTYFDFAIIYPNMMHGGYTLKDIGTTCSGQKCPDDNVTLHSKRFQIGDFLDIAIMLPPKERKDLI